MNENPVSFRSILTWSEITVLCMSGVMRNFSALRKGRVREYGRSDLGFDRHAMGALAEGCVAKYVNQFYLPLIGELDKYVGDVAGRYQIKSTPHPRGNLLVSQDDPAQFPYILVIVNLQMIEPVGWIDGELAKHPSRWTEIDKARNIHKPCFWTKREDLLPMSTLPKPQ